MYISIPAAVLILIGTATLFMYVGLTLGAVLRVNKRDKLPELPKRKICETCRHAIHGKSDCRNSNCAECITTYAGAGWEDGDPDA